MTVTHARRVTTLMISSGRKIVGKASATIAVATAIIMQPGKVAVGALQSRRMAVLMGCARPGRKAVAPTPYGAEYEQGGRYPGTRATAPYESLPSRSADPGQSRYGGFSGEDPGWQRQQLDYGADQSSPRPWLGHNADYDERRATGYGGDDGPADWHSLPPRSRRITPKGYVRSDERLREDLCERLSRSGLDVSDVTVEVSDGTVTLDGTVSDRRTKHAIEDCADDCLGVTDIQNRIRVALVGSRATSGDMPTDFAAMTRKP